MSVVLALRPHHDAILLCADSRLSFTAGSTTRVVNDRACKIVAHHGAAFAAAGWPFWGDRVDAYQVAKRVMGMKPRPVAELAAAFIDEASPYLARYLRDAYDTPRAAHDTGIAPGIQFLFASAHGGRPSLAWRNLAGTGRTANGDERVEMIQAFDWPGTPYPVLVAGCVDAIQRCTIPTFRTEAEAHALGKRLIGVAAAADPDRVSEPVDCLAIRPRSMTWLSRKQTLVYGWDAQEHT